MTSSTISLRERETGHWQGVGGGQRAKQCQPLAGWKSEQELNIRSTKPNASALREGWKAACCSEEGPCKAQRRAEWQGLILSSQSALNPFFDTSACRGGNPKLYLSVERMEKSAVWTLLVPQRDPWASPQCLPKTRQGVILRKKHVGVLISCPLSPLSSAAAVLLRPQLQYVHKHPSWGLQMHHSELCALSDLCKKHKRRYISASPGEPRQKGWDTTGTAPSPFPQEFYSPKDLRAQVTTQSHRLLWLVASSTKFCINRADWLLPRATQHFGIAEKSQNYRAMSLGWKSPLKIKSNCWASNDRFTTKPCSQAPHLHDS